MRLEPIGDPAAIRPEWEAAAQRSGNVFATWEWQQVWWGVRGGGDKRHVFAWRDGGGSLVAVLSLCLGADGVVRFTGHRESDQCGPICAPGDVPRAGDGLRGALDELRGRADTFVGDDLPAGDGWAERLGGRVVERTSSPVVRAERGGWEAYLAGRSASFRGQLRRRTRQLGDHGLRMRLAEDPADFETFLGLHAARWGDRSRSFAGARATLHRRFVPLALDRGWLRLWIAEVEGRPAAAWYGFRFGGAEWYYQAGRDPRWDPASLGFVLLAHTIRAALDDGLHEYRLLRGDEAYKARFATGDAPVETVAVSLG